MDTVLNSVDKVVHRLAQEGPSTAELARVVTKMRSDLIDQMEAPVDRASVLAHATLFDGNPDRVNRIPSELAGVTPAEVKAFAAKYLVPNNRTVLERDPAAASASGAEKNSGGAQ